MTATQRPDEDRLDRVERILAEMAAAQAEANTAHREEMAEIRSILASVSERVDWLTTQQQRTNREMSIIKGWQTELAVERTAHEVFHRLSSLGTLMRLFPKDELVHYTNNGLRRNFITGEEATQASAVDFLMEGVDGSGSPVMFVVEVSYAAGFQDIKRAVERAPLIAKILGREVALPAVVAEVISQEFEDDARAHRIRWTYVANGHSLMQ